MIRLNYPANIGGVIKPAGSIVGNLPADMAARLVESGAAEYANRDEQTKTAKAKKASPEESKAPTKADEFSREELNVLASYMGVDHPENLGDKAAVIEAIKACKGDAKSDEFSRKELNELASFMGVESPEALEDKSAVVEAIKACKVAAPTTGADKAQQQHSETTEAASGQPKADETQQETTPAEPAQIGRKSRKTE